MPGGGTGHTILPLGFDPATGRFPGTWIGSMMSHLWLYGGIARYQDIITLESDDRRILTSRAAMPDGGWQEFMTATYRRTA